MPLPSALDYTTTEYERLRPVVLIFDKPAFLGNLPIDHPTNCHFSGKGPPLWGGWFGKAEPGEVMKKFYIYRNLARGKPSLNLFRHAFRRATFPKGEGLSAR